MGATAQFGVKEQSEWDFPLGGIAGVFCEGGEDRGHDR
jgi:hypothetical protein